MPKAHINNPKDFKKLDLFQLEHYANRWVNKYSVIRIESIILYRHYSEFAEVFGVKAKALFGVKTESTKYALVFEISGCADINLIDIALGDGPIDGDDECTTALKEIEFANHLIPHPLFDPPFADEVYDDEPSIDYFRNWTFRLKRPGDSLGPEILVDRAYWILFQRELIHIPTEKKFRDLIINAEPELIELHQTLLKEVTFSGHIEDREKKFQEAALNRFKKNSDEFEFVRLEYLEDKDLYNFYRPGHEKGDFIGKLLQKILKDHDLGDHGFQKCYDIYKATLKSKTD